MADVKEIPLLATCWTSAGDAAPQRGDEVSPVPIEERVAAIATTGWSGIGLVEADIRRARETIGLSGLSQLIDEAGLRFREVEILSDWWTEGPRRTAADNLKDSLFEAASAIGARNVKVLASLDASPPPWEVFVNEMRELADEAADKGLRLAIEPMPFSSNLQTVREGARFVEEVDRSNVGLTLDTWHQFRAGDDYRDLPKLIDPASLFIVEIDDCLETPSGDLWADTINNRKLPGEGSARVEEFTSTILSMGFEGPWGVEIISTEHRALPVAEALKSAARAAKGVIQRAKEAC